MPRVFQSFLFKLLLTVIISIFIGYQLSKIEIKQAQYSFRKILGVKQVSDSNLEGKIKNFLQNKNGEYAIFVKDLSQDGKRDVYINSDQVFEAASLYKLYLMAAVYKGVNDGRFNLDEELSAKLSHLINVYGSVDTGYEQFEETEVIEYSVREALVRVAEISDNFAALMLAEKTGWNSVQAIAEETGAMQTQIKSPISTTAEDIGLLFEKLYKGEIVSFEASEQILDMLSKSKLNNRIPAKLPDNVKISHKTGELSRVRNDAGIVFLDSSSGGPYVIVLLSKNLKGEDKGAENLSEISRIVFDYYSADKE